MNKYFINACVFAAGVSSVPMLVQAAEQPSSSYNPALSLILSGTYGSFSRDPTKYAIPGFSLASETGPGDQGFKLGESEISMSANADDWFSGVLTASLSPENTVTVEEAFIQASQLPGGLGVKAGHFLSNFGYLNSTHSHTWAFADTALVYRALLGNNYADDGVQLRWVLPTDLYTEVGVEMMRGDGYPFGGATQNGNGASTARLVMGGDVGASNSWQLGLSALRGSAAGRKTHVTDTSNELFTGGVGVDGVDFVWKWAPNGNVTERNLTLQAEYLQRHEGGTYTISSTDYAVSDMQSGSYLQAVYQFMPRWRVGARQDQVQANTPAGVAGTSLDAQGHIATRQSMMVDYKRTEFSQIRLQYSIDNSNLTSDNQVLMQYVLSLGAHGAHTY